MTFSLPAALALTAMLLAACGGGDDRAKVEASLRHYLSTRDPQQTLFPLGAGPPRVTENSCKKAPKFPVPFMRPPKKLAFWECVVTAGKTLTVPTIVVLRGSGNIYWVTTGQSLEGAATTPPPSPPTVYQGGPEQPKP